ncbi:MAG: hypothetical protein RLZZ450_101 [Pseudomonadota bacterium]|jgi:hypothetical protein
MLAIVFVLCALVYIPAKVLLLLAFNLQKLAYWLDPETVPNPEDDHE